MNALTKNALALAAVAFSAQAAAQVTFYERAGFQGESFTTERQVGDFARFGFNDRASSAVVAGERWEVCEDARFGGRCVVLRPGRYASLAAMGLNDRVSSVRGVSKTAQISDNRYAPAPVVEPEANAAPQVTFFESEGFQGRSFTTERQVGDFSRFGFNDRASSAVVVGERWEVCQDARFGGKCVVLRPGRYPSLAAMGLNDRVSSVRGVNKTSQIRDNRYAPAPGMEPPVNAAPQVTFYESEGFQGRSFTTEKRVANFERFGFNDRASSAVVLGDRWEACQDARFGGKCVVLRPGRYPSFAAMGLNDRISSVREINRNTRIDDSRYAPEPVSAYDNRRRRGERVFEAKVTSVRAVSGTPEQRCWIEQEAVPQERSKLNIPGAVVGAVIGGILGHQVGAGRGNDVATVGGAVAGGAVGANVGRGQQPAEMRDVKRCEAATAPVKPDYWDVTYDFRGQEHRVQMTAPPGPTVRVNERGEPRA